MKKYTNDLLIREDKLMNKYMNDLLIREEKWMTFKKERMNGRMNKLMNGIKHKWPTNE